MSGVPFHKELGINGSTLHDNDLPHEYEANGGGGLEAKL